jgi:hypothetical protein
VYEAGYHFAIIKEANLLEYDTKAGCSKSVTCCNDHIKVAIYQKYDGKKVILLLESYL